MSLFTASVPSIVIPSGASVSASIEWDRYMHDAEAVTIIAPATLDVLTFGVEVSNDNSDWKTLNDTTNTAIELPDQDCAITYNGIFGGYKYLRFKASGTVAADRTFIMKKVWRGI